MIPREPPTCTGLPHVRSEPLEPAAHLLLALLGKQKEVIFQETGNGLAVRTTLITASKKDQSKLTAL